MIEILKGEQTVMAVEDDESWMQLDDDFPKMATKSTSRVKRGGAKLIELQEILKGRRKRQKIHEKRMKLASQDESDSSGDGSPDEDHELAKRQKAEQMLDENHELYSGDESDSELSVMWGEKVFGLQTKAPEFCLSGHDDGLISRILNFNPGEGRSSTGASLTSNGLLLSWIISKRRCDKTTVKWIFHQMAFSSTVKLGTAACKLLCDLLVRKAKDGRILCKLEWLPKLEDIMDTLRVYGYLGPSSDDAQKRLGSGCTEKADSGQTEKACDIAGSGTNDSPESTSHVAAEGPSQNIRFLLQFLETYIGARKSHGTLSLSQADAESLLITLLRCKLDRQLLIVSDLLQSCLEALIHFFTEEEWTSSSKRLAVAVSRISSKFVDRMHLVKGLHSTTARLVSLQRLIVLHLLSERIGKKRALSNADEVVAAFKSVHPKDKDCDFANLHHLLVLADIYLWSDPSVQSEKTDTTLWLKLLRKCSSQISMKSLKPDAMKVRNWSAFLSQKYQVEKMRSWFIA